MYGFRGHQLELGKLHEAQRIAHDNIVSLVIDLYWHLSASSGDRVEGGWSRYEDLGSAPPLRLNAAIVSVPTCAGTCDPTSLITGPLLDSIRSADQIFPDPPGGLDRFAGFYSGDRAEYVKPTMLQLRAGLLTLGLVCRAGATVSR